MKLIVDDKIPYIKEALARLGVEATYAPGRDIGPALVRDADALMVRTRTRCDRRLLEGSRVRFIATATIGFDHIDTAYCRQAGIEWANAPGCNASSVEQYVQSALCVWSLERHRPLQGYTLGIVGVGHVGSKVARMAHALGMRVLLNDPPRQEREGGEAFSTMEELTHECDILTFHVPLSREGTYPTYHLADAAWFGSLRRRPLVINTSRGEVADTRALLQALDKGQAGDAIIDVWEHEPDISQPLLQRVLLGTPHIAGYSADGKAGATRMALDALCRHFRLKADYHIEPPAPANPLIVAADEADACLQMYDPRRDSTALKAHPEAFETLRGNYPLRRERTAYRVEIKKPAPARKAEAGI